jgi:hypothetical protein
MANQCGGIQIGKEIRILLPEGLALIDAQEGVA